MATAFRPRSGHEDDLRHFADLQRQAAEQAAPLRTRQRRRGRARVRRVAVRVVLVLLPLLLAALLAADTAGSRTWLADTWEGITRSATAGEQ